ncbi:MAG: hypothetical protein ACREBB_01805 [Nitrosotalea sp.]
MKTKYIIYIFTAALTISLIGNEILYESLQSLQKEIKEYYNENNKIIQKGSMLSDALNKTVMTSP